MACLVIGSLLPHNNRLTPLKRILTHSLTHSLIHSLTPTNHCPIPACALPSSEGHCSAFSVPCHFVPSVESMQYHGSCKGRQTWALEQLKRRIVTHVNVGEARQEGVGVRNCSKIVEAYAVDKYECTKLIKSARPPLHTCPLPSEPPHTYDPLHSSPPSLFARQVIGCQHSSLHPPAH